jgi:uncharacterized membrane protein YqaE (UPF0057 family)
LLILFGVMALVDEFVALSAWAWVAVLAAGGLGVFAVYLTDRSAWGLLLTAYVLLTVAVLVALAVLDVPDSLIPDYVLVAIAMPFLAVFLRKRSQWWALIPAYVLVAVAGIVTLDDLNLVADEFVGSYVLAAIALPFLVVFARNRSNWWALVPAYVLLSIAAMIALIELEVLGDLVVPAYVMFTVAIPFFVVYARNPKNWWALIPAGIMTVIGASFLIAENLIQYVVAAAMILAGLYILVRQLTRKAPTPDASAAPEDESPFEGS